MRERLLRQRRSQPAVWPDGPALESCPTTAADSWRPVARKNHETDPDALRLVFLSGIPRPQPAARDFRRSPRPADHVGAAKKTAVCSGCGTRSLTVDDRTTRWVRDTDAAGWRIYLACEQPRVACARCQGVKVERLDWLARNPRYPERFATRSAPCVGRCRTRPWPSCCTCLNARSRTWTSSPCKPGWPRRLS